jgi:hypothetical protein
MRQGTPIFLSNAHGATLADALIAFTIVITVTAGVAQLLVWSRRSSWSAGTRSMAVILAAQKIEQLRSLPWHVDVSRVPRSDETTDLSSDSAPASGTGLQPSPSGTLDGNTSGFVDYLAADGGWRGNGTRAPASAAFVRRWAIEPFAGDPADSVILTVRVIPIADAPSAARSKRSVQLTTIRTRTSE